MPNDASNYISSRWQNYFYFAAFVFARVVEIIQIQNSKCRYRNLTPNRAAMTQSSNRLRRFLPHGPFARSRKHDFPNICNDDLLSNAFDLSLSLFWPTQATSSARCLHVSHLFFSCSFGDAIHTVFNQK